MYEHLADFLIQSLRSVTPIFFVVIFQVSLVLVFMVGVIVYKLLVYRPLASNPSTRARAQQIANVTGAFVNLTIIMILSRVGIAAEYSQLMFRHQ